MAIVTRKLRNGKPVYWVTFRHLGKDVWERIGGDYRKAERRDAQQKAERKAGNYRPGAPSNEIRVRRFFAEFVFPNRKNRAAGGEEQMVTDHALSRDWFGMMRMIDVEGRDLERLINELVTEAHLAPKSIGNIWSVIRWGYRRAIFEKLRSDNPCDTLDPKSIPRAARSSRTAYERGEARSVMALPETPDWTRVLSTLLFYTGQREGEAVGRRWRDWQTQATPLSVLRVHTQYDDQPLKGDDKDKVRPRYVPIHPALRAVLEYWWHEGFELQHLRKPTLDDFIIPAMGGGCLARSAAYKGFRRALARAQVANRSLHSTRHTFITVARAGTLRHDLVELITHNAKGKTLDAYTHAEWEQLCEVIMGTDYSLDRITTAGFFSAPTLGLEPWPGTHKPHEIAESTGFCLPGVTPQNPSWIPLSDDTLDATQDPDAEAFAVTLAESPGAHPPAERVRSTPSIIRPAEPPAVPGLRTVVEFRGERKTVTEWAAETGIHKKTLAARLVNGWTVERALTVPFDRRKSHGTTRPKPPRKTRPYIARKRVSP